MVFHRRQRRYRTRYRRRGFRKFKRRFGGKYRKPNQLRVRGFNNAIIQDHAFVKMKYSQTTRLTPAATQTYYEFRANSVFDPDLTGVGGQPNGFDQWTPFYGRYRVWASSIKAEVVNLGTQLCKCWIYPVNTSQATKTFDNALGYPYIRYRNIPINGNNNTRNIKNYITMYKFKGYTKKAFYGDNGFQSLTSTNPASQIIWHFGGESIDAATNIDVAVTFTLNFYVELFERAPLDQS